MHEKGADSFAFARRQPFCCAMSISHLIVILRKRLQAGRIRDMITIAPLGQHAIPA